MKFNPDQVKQLRLAYCDVKKKYTKCLLEWSKLADFLPSKESKEYFQHGFMRRFTTLKRCIDNIYRIWPPERTTLLSEEEREDLVINLQAFIFNVFGSLENINQIVNMVKNKTDSTCIQKLKKHLESDRHKKWNKYLQNFRHALGHRIPLYVPPFIISPEKTKLYSDFEKQAWEALLKKDFDHHERLKQKQGSLREACPLMTHSFSEKSYQVFFHSQVLADFNTVIGVAEKLIDGLRFDKKISEANCGVV